ncbi:AraC family transcriptional regulator N-terminal domain-containing protein [Streptomyces sp. NPDC005533]|uniref:AraC family transcriptional regulator n=1 Tax=Streptomyces sp. NPDC005533 TaxID=3364723 RepID=UPI003676D3A0
MDLEELRSLLARHARPDATTAVDGVLVSKVDRSEAPEPATTGTVLAVIAQGTKRLALGDRVLEYGAGQYLVASVDLPVTGRFLRVGPDCPALGFGLVLEPSDIAELLLLAGPGDVPRAGDGAVPALADSGLSQGARAVAWIRSHYAEPFRVEDLAQLSGMSQSAFYRNFQAVTAMSPLRFQKQIRLQEARLLLAAGPGDVTGVAHRVGYDSPSQFSREYRRQFGAPPSKDAARVRLMDARRPSVTGP